MSKSLSRSGALAPTIVVLTLMFTGVFTDPAAAQGGPATVMVAPVETREIADTVPVIASLVGTRNAEVATRAAGIVAEVLVDVGDAVAAGRAMVRLDDQLARIEQDNAAASVAAAGAAVDVAESRARLTEQSLARAEALRGSTAFSRSTFEDLEEQLAEARSEIARAEAQRGVAAAALARAEYVLEHSVIYAPFEGVVIDRMAEAGEYIAIGDPVAQLLDMQSLEIEADVPVDLVEGVMPGTRIAGTFDGGYETVAIVRTLLPVETTSTRTRTVRLALDDGALAPDRAATGRSVTLRVPASAPRGAVTIPKDALVQSRGAWTVFVVEDGVAASREVRLGQPAGNWIEIRSGLDIGEYVVTRGNERLRPGQPIAPVLSDGQPLGAPAEGTADAPAEVPGDATSPAGNDPASSAAVEPDRSAVDIAIPRVPRGSAAAATRPAPASGARAASGD